MTARKGPDPISALIEAHAHAVKAQKCADLSLVRLQDRIDARPSEKRCGPDRRLTCRAPLFPVAGRNLDPATFVRSREEIACHVWGVIDRAAFGLGRGAVRRMRSSEKAAVAELQRTFDAFLRAHNESRKAAGLTAREKAAEDAERVASRALMALVKTTPDTPEGAKAFALHLSTLSPSLAPWWVMKTALVRLAA